MKLTNVIGAVLGATLLSPQAGYCQKLIAAGTLDTSPAGILRSRPPSRSRTAPPATCSAASARGWRTPGGDLPRPAGSWAERAAVQRLRRQHDLVHRPLPDLRLPEFARSGPGAALPFTLKPTLEATTLLSERHALVYGTARGARHRERVRPGPQQANNTYYFTGRSDNFGRGSFDELRERAVSIPSIRVSSDGKSIFVSDEYGPYHYEFDRASGCARGYALPSQVRRQHL